MTVGPVHDAVYSVFRFKGPQTLQTLSQELRTTHEDIQTWTRSHLPKGRGVSVQWAGYELPIECLGRIPWGGVPGPGQYVWRLAGDPRRLPAGVSDPLTDTIIGFREIGIPASRLRMVPLLSGHAHIAKKWLDMALSSGWVVECGIGFDGEDHYAPGRRRATLYALNPQKIRLEELILRRLDRRAYLTTEELLDQVPLEREPLLEHLTQLVRAGKAEVVNIAKGWWGLPIDPTLLEKNESAVK